LLYRNANTIFGNSRHHHRDLCLVSRPCFPITRGKCDVAQFIVFSRGDDWRVAGRERRAWWENRARCARRTALLCRARAASPRIGRCVAVLLIFVGELSSVFSCFGTCFEHAVWRWTRFSWRGGVFFCFRSRSPPPLAATSLARPPSPLVTRLVALACVVFS